MPLSLSRILQPTTVIPSRRLLSSATSSPSLSLTSLHVASSPPSPAALEYATVFFSPPSRRRPADIYPNFLWATDKYASIPASERRMKHADRRDDHNDGGRGLVPEVAILGRSNVGKSSLINALIGSPMCRSSTNPGMTKTITAYGILGRTNQKFEHPEALGLQILHGTDSRLVIVDMPGYGAGSRAEWGSAIMQYLRERETLRHCIVLIDAKVGFKSNDEQLLRILHDANISHQIVLARGDKHIPPSKEPRLPKHASKAERRGQQPSPDEYLASVSPMLRERLFNFKNALATKGFPLGEGPMAGEIISCCSWGARGAKLMGKGKRKSSKLHVPWGIAEIRWAILKAVGYAREEKDEQEGLE